MIRWIHYFSTELKTKIDVIPRSCFKIFERTNGWFFSCGEPLYHDLLHKAKLPTLELGRERSIAILTYKILHDQEPSYLKDLINCNRNSKLYLPYKSTKHGINSFSYQAPRIWNSLPETTRNAPSLPSFKTRLKGWTGLPGNRCGCCSGEQ